MRRLFLFCIVATMSIQGQIPTDGLVAYYPFNGNAQDASGKNLHCRVVNASLIQDRAGNANAAYSFNGTSSYISTIDSVDSPDSVTISLWFKTSSANGSGGYLIGFSQSGDGDIHDQYYQYDRHLYLGDQDDGKAYFGISVSGAKGIQSLSNVNDGAWRHALGWFDQRTMKIYIDGVLQGTRSSWAGLRYQGYWIMGYHDLTEWGWIQLGDSAHSDYLPADFHFSGAIDDVRIYNRALSGNEIAALAAEFPGNARIGDSAKRSKGSQLAIMPRLVNGGLELVCSSQNRANVEIGLHSLSGCRIATLYHGLLLQGRHTIVWNGSGALPGGAYLLRMEGAGPSERRTIVVR